MEVRRVPMEELYLLLETQLEYGSAQLTVTGTSMTPTFREGRDLVRLEKNRPLRRGDVILYRRDNGRYVLHRLMRMDGERLVCCGDRQTELETIRGEQVLAVVTAFCRKGVWRDVKDPLYRLYVQLWMILPLRRAAFALREGLRRSGLRP